MRIATHHLSSQGGRPENQDRIKQVAGDRFTLFVLADGLGGQGDGALAALQCVESAAEAFARAPGLSDDEIQVVVAAADQAVAALRVAQDKPAASMRTTLALLAIYDDTARWAHVGDSRIYWFRDKALMQRTRDHSVAELVAGMADRSLAATPDDTDRNRLLRVIGNGTGCRADLGETTVALRPGDAFLLCSDGIWSLVPDAEIEASLAGAATPQDWCAGLEGRLRQQIASRVPSKFDDYSMILGMVMP